jgi:hypothetical protein
LFVALLCFDDNRFTCNSIDCLHQFPAFRYFLVYPLLVIPLIVCINFHHILFYYHFFPEGIGCFCDRKTGS